MGAVPKTKPSKARRSGRRGHHRARVGHLVPCRQCRTLRPSHHACPNCGHYKGRTVLPVEA